MAGWIKLHRSIQEHWLYTEKRKFSKFEAWNDILLTVNFTEGKTIIKGKLIQIKRGESILSLDSWAKRWGWDKSAVRRFLNTLQKDNMIELKNETITTRLIVCKYDTYQDMRNGDETQTKRKRNADETHLTPIEEGKEGKEGKEEKEIKYTPSAFSFYHELLKLGAEKQLVSDWLAVRKNKKLTNTQTALNKFLKQVEISNYGLNEVLEKCVEKSWGGFEADWYKKNNSDDFQRNRSTTKVTMFG